jgi:hypothetical protein
MKKGRYTEEQIVSALKGSEPGRAVRRNGRSGVPVGRWKLCGLSYGMVVSRVFRTFDLS